LCVESPRETPAEQGSHFSSRLAPGLTTFIIVTATAANEQVDAFREYGHGQTPLG
jgi:hypothetical protein